MIIRESLQTIISQHPNIRRIIEQQQNSQLLFIVEKIHQTFDTLNKDMCITPDIPDFSVQYKDPILILDLIVKMFALCNANIKQNGLNSFDKLIQRLIKLIHSQDTQKCLEDSARLAIQNFDLKKKFTNAQHNSLIIGQKLLASEQAYKNVVLKATQTINFMKTQFSNVLDLLKRNESLMLKLENNNKLLKQQKAQLQVFIKDYKQTLKYRKDPDTLKQRQFNILKNKYEWSIKQMESQYKTWWLDIKKKNK